MRAICMVSLPLCSFEKSSNSSTREVRRVLSLTMTVMPFSRVILSGTPYCMVSAQPLMAVSGVLSS